MTPTELASLSDREINLMARLHAAEAWLRDQGNPSPIMVDLLKHVSLDGLDPLIPSVALAVASIRREFAPPPQNRWIAGKDDRLWLQGTERLGYVVEMPLMANPWLAVARSGAWSAEPTQIEAMAWLERRTVRAS